MATLRIVCCSVPEDKKLMESLRAHLRVLEIQHVGIWYAHNMLPGTEWEQERDRQMQSAHLILFLVSSDFLNSRKQYEKTVLPAMERYKRGETHVIPVILRPVHWQETPFGNLQPLPQNGKPVTDESWKTLDHALFDVVHGIKRVIGDEKLSLLAKQGNDDSPLLTYPGEAIFADSKGTVLQRGRKCCKLCLMIHRDLTEAPIDCAQAGLIRRSTNQQARSAPRPWLWAALAL